MIRTAVDTSVIVAALQEWHDDHHRCLAALDESLAAQPVVLPIAALVESYSVLTRLPPPHRLRAADAWRMLADTFRDAADLAPTPVDAWAFLADLAAAGVTGGTVYDAIILDSAVAAGAGRILTLNLRHFDRLAPEGLEVVAPPPV